MPYKILIITTKNMPSHLKLEPGNELKGYIQSLFLSTQIIVDSSNARILFFGLEIRKVDNKSERALFLTFWVPIFVVLKTKGCLELLFKL